MKRYYRDALEQLLIRHFLPEMIDLGQA